VKYLKDLPIVLSTRESRLVAEIVNTVGDGCHPFITIERVQGLGVKYVRECLVKAIPNLTEFHPSRPKQTAQAILNKLPRQIDLGAL